MLKKNQKSSGMGVYSPLKMWITKFNKPNLPLNWGFHEGHGGIKKGKKQNI